MKSLIVTYILTFLFLTITITEIKSQGIGINNSGNTADPSSILDLSSTTQGFLIPRMSTTQRNAISTPAEGLLIYNITTKCFEFFSSGLWQTGFCASGCIPPATPDEETHIPSQTQIIWNWDTVVGVTGYKWNTINDTSTATDNGISTTFTQTPLSCNTAYTLYVWSYNSCGYSGTATLSETTSACSSVSYATGNEAYWTERTLGFRPVTIGGGSTVYTYDTVNSQYRNGNNILIPNLIGTADGETVDATNFWGFSGGTANNNNYQWDAQSNPVVSQPSIFDKVNMFISPISSVDMNYCSALNYISPNCGSTIIDGPNSTLAYPSSSPQSGTYNLASGAEQINAGAIKGGAVNYYSQQQLDPTSTKSYCVITYGKGWRIPTDVEMGHTTDNYGWSAGIDPSYNATSGGINYHLWSTARELPTGSGGRFILWPLGTPQNGYWDGNTISATNQKVRCVF